MLFINKLTILGNKHSHSNINICKTPNCLEISKKVRKYMNRKVGAIIYIYKDMYIYNSLRIVYILYIIILYFFYIIYLYYILIWNQRKYIKLTSSRVFGFSKLKI